MNNWSTQFESSIRGALTTVQSRAPLVPETTLGDLQLDSLGVMALITSLECDFDQTFPPEILAAGFDTTLEHLWRYLNSNQSRSTAA